MNNNIVKQLKVIAKERGIKGYYRLRKAELINALEATRLVEQKSSIFDEPIPNDPTPVLQPTPNFIAKSIQKIKDFGNWLLDYIPSKPKLADEALASFKNLIKH